MYCEVITVIKAISFLALMFSIFGNISVNNKKKIGFVLWIISNVFWILVNIIDHWNTAQVAMYVCYTVINIVGLIRWSEDERAERKKVK